MQPAIEFKDVSKRFFSRRQKPFLAREIANRLFRRRTVVEETWALRGVSLEVHPGECLGVIGPNGSGKSTLLSLAAGIIHPTSGSVSVRGRIGPLLELGAGFHPDLTGYENIFLNASLLGLSREEVEEKLQQIIDFSELGDFIHAPLHTYSSGMQARLGFAVVSQVDAQVILVDETLAVGDAHFQAKCEVAVRNFVEKGCTMLIVSHDLSTVQRMCSRAAWIDQGKLRALGEAEDVCKAYQESVGV